MKRERVEELISRSLDDELNDEERHQLAQALANSAEYRELANDLRELVDLAKHDPVPAPTVDLAARLQARVDANYAQRSRIIAFRQRRPSVVALAAAALCAALLGWWWQAAQPATDPNMADLRADLQSAQQQYHTAVSQLEAVARRHLDSLPQDIADDYIDSLAVIDQAINSCETMTMQQPDAFSAYASLERAYHAKADLLQSIMNQ